MKNVVKIKELIVSSPIPILISLSFLVWLSCFRGFLLGELALVSDATAYYEHFRFYIDNLGRGVYPLWDPSRYLGCPIEFFLRRIGSFNPLFLVMLIFHKLGMPHYYAYVSFLCLYYWIGMIGFYLLAQQIFQKRYLAFTAYLLLMFSSLGTRLFDSYILLTIIPMIWFFNFLVAFCRSPRGSYLLGLTLALIIMLTTYVPFYFLLIFLTFIFSFFIFYSTQSKTVFRGLGEFIRKNKLLFFFCAVVVLLSTLPGALLFQHTGSGEMALPQRHYQSEDKNVMSVNIKTIMKWGMEEDLLYSSVFLENLRNFKFAVVYIPGIILIILALGLITPMSRRLGFFLFWIVLLYVICSDNSPIYPFLYDTIFFFKYFRNLHFFIWFIFLPLCVLFAVEQFKLFVEYCLSVTDKRIWFLIYIGIIHAGLGVLLVLKGNVIPTTVATLLLSLGFFVLLAWGWLERKEMLFLSGLLVLIVLQPLEVYHYLSRNVEKNFADHMKPFNHRYLRFALPEDTRDKLLGRDDLQYKLTRSGDYLTLNPTQIYMGVSSYIFLQQNLRSRILSRYLYSKFNAYDTVEPYDTKKIDLKRIGRAFLNKENVAFVPQEQYKEPQSSPRGSIGRPAEAITQRSNKIKILDFDVNEIKFKTNFAKDKFLVYNDNYFAGWQAAINGRKTDLFKANVAFKGLWVPAGEQTVRIYFGEWWRRLLNGTLLLLFQIVFFSLLYLWWRDRDSIVRDQYAGERKT